MDDADEMAVMNPADSGLTAHFGWAGKPYELKPGEGKVYPTYLANHARKHNPFLIIMQGEDSAAAFAESELKLAQHALDGELLKLEEQNKAVQRAQRRLQQADSNLKTKRQQEIDAQNAERDRAQREQEAAKAAADLEAKKKGVRSHT